MDVIFEPNTSGLVASIDDRIPTAEKGAPNGVATLTAASLITATQGEQPSAVSTHNALASPHMGASPTFADLSITSPGTAAQSATTRAYVQSLVAGVGYQGRVVSRSSSTPPLVYPAAGTQYIVKAVGAGLWTGYDNQLVRPDGLGDWLASVPLNGQFVVVDDESIVVIYDSGLARWDPFPITIDHESTTGLQGGAVGDHVHVTAVQSTGLTGGSATTLHKHAQATSHESSDTDSATTALHHTLGTGANQASQGNHLHTGVYDPAGSAAAAQAASEPVGTVATHNSSASAHSGAALTLGTVSVTGLTDSSLTASRLVSSNGSKRHVSSVITDYLSGTTNQVVVTPSGAGAVLSTPQDIHAGASPTFADLTLTGGASLGASIRMPYATTAISATLAAGNSILNVTSPSTITVPAAAAHTGRILTVVNDLGGVGTVTVTCADLINGVTSYLLARRYQSITIQSTGTTWRIVGGYGSRPGYRDSTGSFLNDTVTSAEAVQEPWENTGFSMWFLRHDRDGVLYRRDQFNHDRRLNSSVASIHLHYFAAASGTGNVQLELRYRLVPIMQAMGLIGDWTTITYTLAITPADYGLHTVVNLATNIPILLTDTHSAMMLMRISRVGTNVNDTFTTSKASGTAQANFGVLDLDCHYLADELGTYTEYSD